MDKVILTNTLDDGAQIVPDLELEVVEPSRRSAHGKYCNPTKLKKTTTI